jgi:hypothetical protein
MPEEYMPGRTTDPATWLRAHTENLDRLAAFTREASTRRAYKDRPKPEQHRMYAALIGGPLGGLLLDITGWQLEEDLRRCRPARAGAVAWRPGAVRFAPRRHLSLLLLR